MNEHQQIYKNAVDTLSPQKINRGRFVFGKLEKAAAAYQHRGMEIGYAARLMEDEDLYQTVGLKDKKDCYLTLKMARSTYYRLWRIANGFPDLEEDVFVAMSAENANLLVDNLPIEERQAPYWVEKASTETEESFEKMILAYNAEKTNTPIQEQRVAFKLGMSEGQKTVINEGIENFCLENGIENPARGLELIVAEMSGRRSTLLSFIQDSLGKLRSALELVSDDLEPETVIPRVKEILEEYILGLSESLNG